MIQTFDNRGGIYCADRIAGAMGKQELKVTFRKANRVMEQLRKPGLKQSFSRVGIPVDNAWS